MQITYTLWNYLNLYMSACFLFFQLFPSISKLVTSIPRYIIWGGNLHDSLTNCILHITLIHLGFRSNLLKCWLWSWSQVMLFHDLKNIHSFKLYCKEFSEVKWYILDFLGYLNELIQLCPRFAGFYFSNFK